MRQPVPDWLREAVNEAVEELERNGEAITWKTILHRRQDRFLGAGTLPDLLRIAVEVALCEREAERQGDR